MKKQRTAYATRVGRNRLIGFTVLIINVLYACFAAAASEPAFSHLTMADGLSHYSVMATYQDEHGLLWIGTRGGLDVYDGTHIRNYRKIPGDNFSPMSNYVRSGMSKSGRPQRWPMATGGCSMHPGIKFPR